MGFSIYGYRTPSESAVDNEVPLYLSGAYKSAVQRVAPGVADEGLDVYADELIQEHAGGKIWRAGYGPQSSPTWMATLTSGGLTVKGGLFEQGGTIVNVKAFGDPTLVGTNEPGLTDQNAIDAAFAAVVAAAQAMNTSSGDGRAVRLHFPAGRYNQNTPIVIPILAGFQITGDGDLATVFGITTGPGTNGAAYWADKAMWYLVGGNGHRLSNLSLSPNSWAEGPVPEAGLVVAANAATTNPFGDPVTANNTNANYFDFVSVRGAFIKGAHVSYAAVSSVYVRCAFARSRSLNPTYPNGVGPNEASLVLSRDNEVGIHNPPTGAALVDPVSGSTSNSDLTFIACEVQDAVPATSATQCACPPVWIEEGYAIRFYGGNWAGRGNPCGYARLSHGTSGAGALFGCRNILLDGVQLYEGDGVTPAAAPATAFYVSGNKLYNGAVTKSKVMFHTNDVDTFTMPASDITIRNCNIKVVSGGALFGGGQLNGSGGTINLVRAAVENVSFQDSGTPQRTNYSYAVNVGGPNVAALWDCRFDVPGLQISLGAGGVVNGRPLHGIRVATAAAESHGEHILHGGGAVALAASGTVYVGSANAHATETNVIPLRVAQACRIRNFRLLSNVAPGASQGYTGTVRVATPGTGLSYADTPMATQISGTNVTATYQTDDVLLAAGDVITVKVTATGGAAAGAWFAFSLSAWDI